MQPDPWERRTFTTTPDIPSGVRGRLHKWMRDNDALCGGILGACTGAGMTILLHFVA